METSTYRSPLHASGFRVYLSLAVTSTTKSIGIIRTMPFWDERFEAMAKEFPDVSRDQNHIDILTSQFVQHPVWFDVVVAINLFGDIHSDLGAHT